MAHLVIVGLGTTGVNIIRRMQDLTHSRFGVYRLPHVRFVWFNTNEGDVVPHGDCHYDMLRCENYSNGLAEIREHSSAPWLPAQATEEGNSQGAGNRPVMGRLALWSAKGGRRNTSNVFSAINSALGQLGKIEELRREIEAIVSGGPQESQAGWRAELEDQALAADPSTYVIVVGSLTGGTASGTFMDVGQLARLALGSKHKDRVIAVMLAPALQEESQPTYVTNAWSQVHALEELAELHCEGEKNYYEKQLPGGYELLAGAPFARAYLLSMKTGYNIVLGSVSELEEQAAMFLHALPLGLMDHIAAMWVDYKSVGCSKVAGEGWKGWHTFGMGGVVWPSTLLERSLLLNLVKNGLDELKGNRNAAELERKAVGRADKIAARFRARLTASREGVEPRARGLLNRARSGEIHDLTQAINEEFMEDRPDPGTIGSMIRKRTSEARKEFRDDLEDLTREWLDDDWSLGAVRKALDQVSARLEQTMTYWGSDAGADAWAAHVDTVANRIAGGPGRILLRQREGRWMELQQLIDDMCMRRASEILDKDLSPQIDKLKALIGKLESICNAALSQVSTLLTNLQREADAGARPIVHIWAHDSYEQDLEEAKRQVAHGFAATVKDLWDLLTLDEQKKAPQEMIRRYEENVRSEVRPAVAQVVPPDLVSPEKVSDQNLEQMIYRVWEGMVRIEDVPPGGKYPVPHEAIGQRREHQTGAAAAWMTGPVRAHEWESAINDPLKNVSRGTQWRKKEAPLTGDDFLVFCERMHILPTYTWAGRQEAGRKAATVAGQDCDAYTPRLIHLFESVKSNLQAFARIIVRWNPDVPGKHSGLKHDLPGNEEIRVSGESVLLTVLENDTETVTMDLWNVAQGELSSEDEAALGRLVKDPDLLDHWTDVLRRAEVRRGEDELKRQWQAQSKPIAQIFWP